MYPPKSSTAIPSDHSVRGIGATIIEAAESALEAVVPTSRRTAPGIAEIAIETKTDARDEVAHEIGIELLETENHTRGKPPVHPLQMPKCPPRLPEPLPHRATPTTQTPTPSNSSSAPPRLHPHRKSAPAAAAPSPLPRRWTRTSRPPTTRRWM